MEAADQPQQAPRPDQIMDYDAILRTQRELTPENFATAAKLVDLSMAIVKQQKPDPKTGFKTAYLMTRKITGTNFLNRKVDSNGNRFYVMVRDFNGPYMDNTKGLIVSYTKTGPDLEQISHGQWELPRSSELVNDQYLNSMRSKNEDWSVINELVSDLEANSKAYKKGMLIDEETYKKRTW